MKRHRLGACGMAGFAAALAALLAGCPDDVITVLSTTPVNGAVGVSTGAVLTVRFDAPARPDTLDIETEPEFSFSASWSADARTVTLAPDGALQPNMVYTITVWDLEPTGGGSIEGDYSFSFTTAGGGTDSAYRQSMRAFVQDIAAYARQTIPGFIVIPQNGEALMTIGGAPTGALSTDYVAAIDGQGREDLFYGYDEDNQPTPDAARNEMVAMLEVGETAGVEALVTDYCWTPARVDDSYAQNAARGFTSFAAPSRDLDAIPAYPATPHNVNAFDINGLYEAQNFLYVLDPGAFETRAAYLAALAGTDYDAIVLDLFYDDTALSPAELDSLRIKHNGGMRLLIAYMSIGEAEDYRYYWQPGWAPGSPQWIEAENPGWAGNYKVRYWDPEWQAIILGGPSAYLDRIVAAGFDGVYLDIIDAYEYFEE